MIKLLTKMMTMPLAVIAVVLWCSISKADPISCLGKCDQYKDYYCSSFFGVCEPCIFRTDSPKCAEFFESIEKQPTPAKPRGIVQEELPSTSEQTPKANESFHEDTTPFNPLPKTDNKNVEPEPESNKNDKERDRPSPHKGDTNPQQQSNTEEKHTNVIIIIASASMVTLCVGTVVRLHRRHRSPNGGGNTTVMASGDDEGLLQVGFGQRIGAAGEIAQHEQEAAV